MTQGIYEIMNLEDGKTTSYVGGSVNIECRWNEHVRDLHRGDHGNSYLQRAWNKYGEGAFSFCVLEQVESEKNLLRREQYWLDCAFEAGNIYNIARDAVAPMRGLTFSEEHKRKIGEANKGENNYLWGKHLDEEHKRKISEALKGREVSKEHRHALSKALKGRESPFKGKHHSEEAKHKISEANKGKNNPHWGKCPSKETRYKMSEAHAKPYPAFVHLETGKVIPAGINLARLCKERGLNKVCMCAVKNNKRNHHKGWILLRPE